MDFPITPFDLFVICFIVNFISIHLSYKYTHSYQTYNIYDATQHLTDITIKYKEATSRGEVFVPNERQVAIVKQGFYITAEFTVISLAVAAVVTYCAFYVVGPGK